MNKSFKLFLMAALICALSALFIVGASAAQDPPKVEVTSIGTNVTITETDAQVEANKYLTLTYTNESLAEGDFCVILMLDAKKCDFAADDTFDNIGASSTYANIVSGGGIVSEDNLEGAIRYINQDTLNASKSVTFKVYPDQLKNSIILISTSAGPALVGKVTVDGYEISGTITSFGPAGGTITMQLFATDDTDFSDPKATASVVAEVEDVTFTKYTRDEREFSKFTNEYSFDAVDEGNYILRVSKANHATYTESVSIADNITGKNVLIALLGDEGMNGKVDNLDWITIKNIFLGKITNATPYQLAIGDVVGNSDGIKNLDWITVKNHFLGKTNLHSN